MDPARIDLVKRVYAQWGSGDYSRVDFLHPHYELVFARGFLDEGVHSGWTAAWRGWKGWLDQWELWTYDPVEFIDIAEDRIGVFIDIDGVAKTTGMPLTVKSSNLWEFEDGLVRRLTLYAHREDMLRELGLESA